MLVASSLVLCVVWSFSSEFARGPYIFGLGAMILLELAIHMRHARNLIIFRAVNEPGAVRGRVEYSRRFQLKISALELVSYSALYFLLFVFTFSWFFLGGAASCLMTARKHWRLRRLMPSAGQRKPEAVPQPRLQTDPGSNSSETSP